ncbi:MAG: aspartate aminotransferase family protein [Candidatus Omnitrophica bacterium]|nr:aspartate aminotransferase family protein [Candidatus Omnitrophota bacterium]
MDDSGVPRLPENPHQPDSRLKSEGDINLSPKRLKWAESFLDEETRAWLERDAKVFLHQSLSTPCLDVLKESSGACFTDLSGRTFLDFHGNNVHQVGYGHPHVIEAITREMQQLPFCPRRFTNIPAILLAEKLAHLAPGDLNKVLFAPGGTSAIGMALKLARAATGRYKTISMWDSFHGASLDAISVGGEEVFRSRIGPLLPGSEHVPPPDAYRCLWGCNGSCNLKCADYIEYVLEKEGDVAAVIAETIRCTPFIPPRDYWKKVREACDRHGTLLILDEIPICLGRTGKMFACEHFEVVPDMLVIGKGLGGGIFPLAALIAREDLDILGDRALGHYTHEKSSVGCAAALAALEVIEQEHILEHATRMGEQVLSRLESMKKEHPLIGDVRGTGLLLGIELVLDRETRQRALDEAEEVLYACLSRGLSFKLTMGNILTLTPPLIISDGEMDHALAIIDVALSEVEGKRGMK